MINAQVMFIARRMVVIVTLILATFLATSTVMAAESRPNVIVVLTDDQGSGDFSCHGNPVLRTPQLDRFRDSAVRFTDFHVAPMCTPTRGQLMTGVDAVRNGATSVTGGRSFIRPGIKTMPELMAAAGYRTGLFGKWHLGDNYPHRPKDRGFQESMYHLGWGITAAPEFANSLFDGRYFHNAEPQKFTGHCTDFWFDSAMNWMRDRQAKREPFFVYLPTNAPHAPHDVAEKYSTPYVGKGPERFFGMIAQVDENFGKLEAFLEQTGLRDNTIVIFLTDNGGTAGVKVFNAGLRAGKTTFYDGGHRVPCWVRWPGGKLGMPRDIDTPTQVQDILPTVLELCGVPRPADLRLDGTSLAGVLRGEPGTLADRKFVVQYSRAKLEKWQSCVVWKQWRLVHGEELYDVHQDRAQTNDLAQAQPAVLAQLRAHYEQWWSDLTPLIGKFVTTSLGSDAQPLVELTSSDWQDVYADNAGHVRTAAGGPRGGHWNVNVVQPGEYEIALRRWPREIDTALGDASGPQSKALPIATARAMICGQELTGQTRPTAKEVVLRANLPRGETQLHAWFQDPAGNDLCGAYYAYVRRLR
ncbi:MAG: arylsulfatase [Planctomycetaceae bacterium]|nr:arylsulfatase [Planctomycetaceae bacterium]